MKSLFSSQFSDVLSRESVEDSIKISFNENFLNNITENEKRFGGLIAFKTMYNGQLEFVWAHTTPSMAIGYMSSSQLTPKAVISTMSEAEGEPGLAVKYSCLGFKLEQISKRSPDHLDNGLSGKSEETEPIELSKSKQEKEEF
eukprot:TRINITY_DN5517_c0_g2_i1.p2 TRINITY_DN5517_c0_g2~~TRINITY_DN5517_c0_g2_i1.p2  ORF type:complete len:143 (-),score=36.02 TRINITY_DN5517_c0_g2_i1:3-431(-)